MSHCDEGYIGTEDGDCEICAIDECRYCESVDSCDFCNVGFYLNHEINAC